MATTCKLIAKNVLGSDTATVTFSSIPATYDDLLLLCSARTTRTGNTQDAAVISLNSSTANFSGRRLTGNGSSASSDQPGGRRVGVCTTADATANTFASIEVYIPNYAGSANKSISSSAAHETNATAARIEVLANLWSDTSAITSVDLDSENGFDFVTGSSFYLYGITKA